MLTAVAFVGLAGAGATVRFLASERWPGGHRGTLLVNVLGSLLLGLLTGSGAPVPSVVGVGGLGALTTFAPVAAGPMPLADHPRPTAARHAAFGVDLCSGVQLYEAGSGGWPWNPGVWHAPHRASDRSD